MSELKKFYETATQNDVLKAELTAATEKRLSTLKHEMIDDYISIAQRHGMTLTTEDFEMDSVSSGMVGTGGCVLIDTGCFVFGEIDPHGGCFVIGVR